MRFTAKSRPISINRWRGRSWIRHGFRTCRQRSHRRPDRDDAAACAINGMALTGSPAGQRPSPIQNDSGLRQGPAGPSSTNETTLGSKSSKRVVVVGAGIGGLSAALALLKRDIDVEVYEQSSELKEVGAGIQISSNGTRVLYVLGLEAGLGRVQVLPSRREIRHWSTGETWNWF